MSSQTQTASIQTLLEAEKDAQAIVEKARTYRTQRLKDARSEAAKEVEAYKKKKEEEFKEYESQVWSIVTFAQANCRTLAQVRMQRKKPKRRCKSSSRRLSSRTRMASRRLWIIYWRPLSSLTLRCTPMQSRYD